VANVIVVERMCGARKHLQYADPVPRSSNGTAIMDRAPSRWQAARSTRGSVSASSQNRIRPLLTHIPENPNFWSKRIPRSGAGPCAAMQTISVRPRKAIAAPMAFVANKARSSTGRSNSSTPSGLRSMSSFYRVKYTGRGSGHLICTPPAGLTTRIQRLLVGGTASRAPAKVSTCSPHPGSR